MGHIEDILDKNNITYKMQGQDLVIACLNPDHEDTNPSLRVDRVDGRFHCFSCGFKGNILKYFGVLSAPSSIRIAKLKEKISNLKEQITGLDMLDGAILVNREIRGISKQTLQKFGAFTTDKVTELEDRIIFPITDISNKIVVFVARHLLSQGNPRYVNYPRGVKIPLFPVILERGTKSIVLVEGIFDMLNCYDKGLTNVVCTFGTNTLQSNTKGKLLPYKAQGINKVYILFDGDDAGREAAKTIEPLLKELELQTEIIQLEDDLDPGMLSQDYVSSIKEYINGKDSSNREVS